MKRIIIHWTAGKNVPNSDDFSHYHYLYGEDTVIAGKYKPEDNINCKDGAYAAHTGGLNTDSIGVAFCGMMNFSMKTGKDKNGKIYTIINPSKYPILKQACEVGFKHIAKLAKKYNIPIDEDHVLTHFEVGKKVLMEKIERNQLTAANIGKIDICYLDGYPQVDSSRMGSFIRQKIRWYYDKLNY